MVMKLLEPAPEELTQAVRRRLPPGEEELVRVSSDLAPDGRFGSQWVVVTGGHVLVVPPAGDGGWVALPVGDIAAAREEALVGCGCLEISRKDGPPVRVPHSASLSARFADVARGIEQLRQGEPLLIAGETDRARCDK